jgi:two-component system CheB/CheR fusion protein
MEHATRNEMLSIICHELRNELNPLVTWAEMLRRPDVGAEGRQEAAVAIRRATEIAGRLCDDLAFVAAAGVESPLERVRLDLREIANAGASAITPDARRKGVRVVQRVGAAPVWVVGDRVRLGQVVSNLLRNALTFTDVGGTIAVEVLEVDGCARLVVVDTGTGIHASLLPHVFEKFTQGPRPEPGGRGLGLYVVKHLVELHEGSVEVESDGPARGTRCVVTLPSAAAHAA